VRITTTVTAETTSVVRIIMVGTTTIKAVTTSPTISAMHQDVPVLLHQIHSLLQLLALLQDDPGRKPWVLPHVRLVEPVLQWFSLGSADGGQGDDQAFGADGDCIAGRAYAQRV
jgi:hypothetical protein